MRPAIRAPRMRPPMMPPTIAPTFVCVLWDPRVSVVVYWVEADRAEVRPVGFCFENLFWRVEGLARVVLEEYMVRLKDDWETYVHYVLAGTVDTALDTNLAETAYAIKSV